MQHVKKFNLFSNCQHHFKYRKKHYITLKFATLVVQILMFIKMSKFITLKSLVFRWRHFKVNICCAHHYPVAQHGLDRSPNTVLRNSPHSCSRACSSSCIVWGAGWRLCTCQSKSSHKCSIGFKSGDLDGEGALLRSGWLESQQ